MNNPPMAKTLLSAASSSVTLTSVLQPPLSPSCCLYDCGGVTAPPSGQVIVSEVTVTTRPHIYYCRSPSMEDFTCWWHPLANATGDVTYILTYSKDQGPKRECPNYVTFGPNSCHFDRSHTSIWMIYCMNVTAVTAATSYTSQQHCLDVADIVQTEAPVNLNYILSDAGGDETGHKVLLSWTYPEPSDLQYGWITLVYELQYRRVIEPNSWKVKEGLREPHVELLGLPAGDYVVRVRCRSHNYGLWSHWSIALLMSIPGEPAAGKVLVLVSSVSVVVPLVAVFIIVLQRKRIKECILPPIPKPRIMGIDSLLLKKGKLDEINDHFCNFHSYRPPSFTAEVWHHVSSRPVTPKPGGASSEPTDRDEDVSHISAAPDDVHHYFITQDPASYVTSPAPSCCVTASVTVPPPALKPDSVSWTHLGVPTSRSLQGFYTCVQHLKELAEVQLVPSLLLSYRRDVPLHLSRHEEETKLAEYTAWEKAMTGPEVLKDSGKAGRSDVDLLLLPANELNSDTMK
ncbi:prolactin receptor-like [Thalassophryne amazonica]|uniref:prolactin receptor-like n=1 Tax=Thalassophryne amazonica TaxID=390379 RepID=UPI001470EBE2|nr:prolactin receptor-like [Thalassophryne amazonica]